MTEKRVLAIIGLGPRGSYALENLVRELADQGELSSIEILLFESTPNLGNGPVYDIDQAESNWINISDRILTIDGRPKIAAQGLEVPNFPSYHQWINRDFGEIPLDVPDYYPPRSRMGNYLQQRFESLYIPLQECGLARLIQGKVNRLSMLDNNNFRISTHCHGDHFANEVLLTIGHQPTESSKQMIEWKRHAQEYPSIKVYSSPYPVERFLVGKVIKSNSKIAIRGFGLSMIDVVRAIAESFGEFKNDNKSLQYVTDLDLTNLFLPFSLDGLPLSPKPLNARIDQMYKPDNEQIQAFENRIGDPDIQKAAADPAFLIDPVAKIAANIYLVLSKPLHSGYSFEEILMTAQHWLRDQSFNHRLIIPRTQLPEKSMKQYVDMASGKGMISLDFCIGQVWRHCQPSIYRQLSFNQCEKEVVAEIIELDERMKRYAYGPPVESLRQMLALITAGVMNLQWVNNPSISLSPRGWTLQSQGNRITADVMINAILASAEVNSIDSPLVRNLLKDDLVKVVHDDYGIVTRPDGYVLTPSGQTLPLAVLGRLAKGTIIGVDALMECFGPRISNWAKEAARRHTRG